MDLVSKLFSWGLRVMLAYGIILTMPASAQSCKYTKQLIAKHVGGDDSQKCESACTGYLRIQPFSNGKRCSQAIEGTEEQEIAIEFSASEPLGGEENALCTSNGAVNWGESDEDEPMPLASWEDCNGHHGSRIAAVDSYTPDLVLKHIYHKAGTYCVSATMFANRRVRGAGACSYDCRLENSIRVRVKPKH